MLKIGEDCTAYVALPHSRDQSRSAPESGLAVAPQLIGLAIHKVYVCISAAQDQCTSMNAGTRPVTSSARSWLQVRLCEKEASRRLRSSKMSGMRDCGHTFDLHPDPRYGPLRPHFVYHTSRDLFFARNIMSECGSAETLSSRAANLYTALTAFLPRLSADSALVLYGRCHRRLDPKKDARSTMPENTKSSLGRFCFGGSRSRACTCWPRASACQCRRTTSETRTSSTRQRVRVLAQAKN